MKKNISTTTKEAIIESYNNGDHISAISEQFGVTRASIYALLKRSGIVAQKIERPIPSGGGIFRKWLKMSPAYADKVYQACVEFDKAENMLSPDIIIKAGIPLHHLIDTNIFLNHLHMMLVIGHKPSLLIGAATRELSWRDACMLLRNPQAWIEFKKAGGDYNDPNA